MRPLDKNVIYDVSTLTEEQLKQFLMYMVLEDGDWGCTEKESFLKGRWAVYYNNDRWEDYPGDKDPIDASFLFEDLNYFKQEDDLTEKLFNLQELIEFQKTHEVQIIRGEDFQYNCYIDGKCYCNSLTFLNSLVVGVKLFKEYESKCL